MRGWTAWILAWILAWLVAAGAAQAWAQAGKATGANGEAEPYVLLSGGTTVLLPETGLRLTLPPARNWVRVDTDSFGNVDHLRGIVSMQRRDGVVVSISESSLTPPRCDMAYFQSEYAKPKLPLAPRPAWLPGAFHGQIASGPGARDWEFHACVQGNVSAWELTFRAPLAPAISEGELQAIVGPLGQALANAIQARESAQRRHAQTRLRLPLSQLEFATPADGPGWKLASDPTRPGIDWLERDAADLPALRLGVVVLPAAGGCQSATRELMRSGYRSTFMATFGQFVDVFTGARDGATYPYALCFGGGSRPLLVHLRSASKLPRMDAVQASALVQAMLPALRDLKRAPPVQAPVTTAAAPAMGRDGAYIFAAGATATLPATGLALALPKGDRDWQEQVPLAFQARDRIEYIPDFRNRDKTWFAIGWSRGWCAKHLAKPSDHQVAVPTPPWLPGARPTVLEAFFDSFDDSLMITVCLPAGDLDLSVDLSVSNARHITDPMVRPQLEPLYRAVAAAARERMAKIKHPASLTLALPVAASTLQLAGNRVAWQVQAAEREGQRVDLLTRTTAGLAALEAAVLWRAPQADCLAILGNPEAAGELRQDALLPPGWRGRRTWQPTSRTWDVHLCGPGPHPATVRLRSAVMVDGPDADDVRPLLDALAALRR